MKEFLESLVKKYNKLEESMMLQNIEGIKHIKDGILMKGEFGSFYLFLFRNAENTIEELKELEKNIVEINDEIKNIERQKSWMIEKNLVCIYCIKTTEEKYYETISPNSINELNKTICLLEEDLNYYKKHVLLYTPQMEDFARKYIGRFDELRKEYLTDEKFLCYKTNMRENYEYDFLVNLFIKIPFLKFIEEPSEEDKQSSKSGEKQGGENKLYASLSDYIAKKCNSQNINKEKLKTIRNSLEKLFSKSIEDEDFYSWLDTVKIENDDMESKENTNEN